MKIVVLYHYCQPALPHINFVVLFKIMDIAEIVVSLNVGFYNVLVMFGLLLGTSTHDGFTRFYLLAQPLPCWVYHNGCTHGHGLGTLISY